MKTSPTVVGLVASVLLIGCVRNHEGTTSVERRIGPTVLGGVTYYPAKPGTTYYNTPVDYTTNPPPAGAVNYVTVVSTNGFAMHLIDGPNQTSTGVLPK
jgi:hypothetical protein